MEDSFKLRVERLFGSHLFESVPKSSFPNSSWSVTDGEVERKEWNRDDGESFPDREDMPCASAYEECFAKKTRGSRVPKRRRFEDDLDDVEEEENEEETGRDADAGDVEREEREIRSSIGLDSTLDYEEEEDEYDRAAVGHENATERLYMRDVNDHGPYMNYHTIIEDSSEELHFARDPRADHLAASARLKEDKEGGKGVQHELNPSYVATKPKKMQNDVNLKPILKRKGELIDTKPKKQVRFGVGCKDPCNERPNDSEDLTVPEAIEASGSAGSSHSTSETIPNVPDYIRNPSKYVRYTFDPEDDISDVSNRRAFDDFWKIVRTSKSDNMDPNCVIDPPKSVIFTPRKRATESVLTDHSSRENGEVVLKESSKVTVHVSARSVGIAAAQAQENEVSAMEEDAMDTPLEKNVGPIKSFRQFRSRDRSDDSVC